MSVILGKGSVVESRGRRERAAADTSSGTSGTGTPGGSPRIFAGEHAGSVARGRTGERETRGLFLSLSLGQSPLCHRENSYGRPFIRPARTRSRLRRFRPPFNPGRTAAVIAPPPPRSSKSSTRRYRDDRHSARANLPRGSRRSAGTREIAAAELSPTRRRIPIS